MMGWSFQGRLMGPRPLALALILLIAPAASLAQATLPVGTVALGETIRTLREHKNPVDRYAAVTRLRDEIAGLSDADAAVVAGALIGALDDPSPAVSRTA